MAGGETIFTVTPSKVSICTQGDEIQPVVVIDDFALAPDELIEDVAMLSFGELDAHYPGVRAPVPRRGIDTILASLAGVVGHTFDVDLAKVRASGFYSLATTPPESLRPIQRLPHFDGVERERLAILMFLGRRDNGGTAFYRHRATGFETVSADRLPGFTEALRADIATHGVPPPGYISGSTAIFERIGLYAGRFNRVLVYRGHSLHCADMPSPQMLSNDPRRGRLTINLFVEAPPVTP